MQKIKNFIKKMFSIQMILVIVLTMIISMNTSEVQAYNVTHNQNKVTGINAFPEDYRVKLQELQRQHQSWTFTAFNTGMNWSEFMNSETGTHLRNTIHNSADSSWKDSCNNVASGYACASNTIVAYYADPRNFLTESGIFQFLGMSYDASSQNKAGLQNILANSFMSGSVTVTAEREDTSVKAKLAEPYIYVAPETKNSEVAAAINKPNFRVQDGNNRNVSTSANAGTGYTFTNTANNTSYTMVVYGDVNGDGEVKASDYMKIKNYIMGTTTLSSLQKKASDVNGDGEIKASDYMKIKNHIMGSTVINLSVTTSQKTTMSYADIIMKAAAESGISPYSIAIKIFQEVGRKNPSNSVTGTAPGYEGYYNFYNWGATDGGNAIEKGLIYAKQMGWNNQYTAIVEGAKKLADSYVSVGQNTAYFYKFDVVDDTSTGVFWHQYMTNVQDPSSQSSNLFNTYAQSDSLDLALNFIIPVYNNMPASNLLPSSINTTDPKSYFINGTSVQLRSSPGTNSPSLGSLGSGEIVTVENLNYQTVGNYTWAKIKRANGTVGYVANCYLAKA